MKIAVIDSETNYYDEVISIGVVIADEDYEVIDSLYMIITPECEKPAMFSNELYHPKAKIDLISSRKKVITKTINLLKKYNVTSIFAYNASFDYYHLKELNGYNWYDIMKIAAYKQYNPFIDNTYELCKTGRLKTGYGLERIYRITVGKSYQEIHNALTDALDETKLMKALNHDLSIYEITKIN